jgi:hypothetical protein
LPLVFPAMPTMLSRALQILFAFGNLVLTPCCYSLNAGQSQTAAGRIAGSRNRRKHDMREATGDFTAMDDPEFLAERARVRDELEHTPEQAVSLELAARYQRLNDEFIRRAQIAWTRAS